MKRIAIVALSVLVLMLGGCGSSRQPQIDGSWFAVVNNPDQSPAYPFSATLAQGSGTTVNVTNFGFATSTSCFSTPTSEAATFSAMGSNGTGTFGMTISTVFPALNNVLTLQGMLNGEGSIAGTWTLTGQAGCTGNGNFTMLLPHSDPG
jgi:hypothetical protein